MLTYYLKIIFRNFYKNKSLSLISILGLSIGLGIFIIGLLYLNHEYGYDKGFKDWQNIYRVETTRPDSSKALVVPQPVYDIFKTTFPEIVASTKFMRAFLIQPLLKVNDKSIYINNLYNADSSFFNVFNFPFVYGNIQTALLKPDGIVLSKETSEKLFNNQNPVGKTVLTGSEGDFKPLTVTGVFDNKKLPTHLSIDAVRLMETFAATDINLWNSSWVYTYIKVNPHTNVNQFEKKLSYKYNEAFLNHYNGNEEKKQSYASLHKTVFLQPLSGIYLHSHMKEELSKNGSETSVWLITCLIIFMLIVSAVNFTNLSIAEAPSRAKEIAVRKFTGSTKFNILKQLYLEITIKCFLALLVAILIAGLVLPAFSNALSTPLYLFKNGNVKILWQVIALLACIVLIAGTYPVLYISFFKPVSILKGNFIQSPKTNIVRNALLVIQFMITSVFIAGIFIISSQVNFLRNKDLGYNPHQVLTITAGEFQTLLFGYPNIKQELTQIPGVENISYASSIGQPNDQMQMFLTVNGKEYIPQYVCVDTGYLNVMGAHLISGRNFSSAFSDSLNAIIINRELADELGIRSTNDLVDIKYGGKPLKIIGIVDNINFYGFENKVAPMVFTTMNVSFINPFLLIKLNTNNISSTIHSIESKWQNIEPGYPLQYKFLDQTFQQIYDNYERLNKIFAYFSVCALLIALIGLFALAKLMAVQRSKEVAIRKVLGASLNDILRLLNKTFLKLIVIANLFAVPITFLLARNWLNNFAYRINIPITPFVIAAIILLVLTVFTVSIQALKTASLNPVEKLKEE